ncbi:hypothetical protein P67b_00001 [Ruegeria phage Tedan]|nr:hypothetical protein P67b_00001 [Ruegeria phage Tedan]
MLKLPLFPDLGVTETWQWETDVLEARNGAETRLSLQPAPDVTQRISYTPSTADDRRDQWLELGTSLGAPSIYPLFGWVTSLTGTTASGGTVVQLDTTRISLNAGDFIVLANPATGETHQSALAAVTDTTATLVTALTTEVTPAWVAYKAMRALLGTNRLGFNVVAGASNIEMASFAFPFVQRTGASESLTTFNSIPVLERKILAGLTENIDLPLDVTDFGLGAYGVFTRRTSVRLVRRAIRYSVDRRNVTDIDYWRLFLDTVRGSWKVFLTNSQLEDLVLASPLVPGATTLTITESLGARFLSHAQFANFEISYTDGTSSMHTVVSTAGPAVSFTPALPNDPKVTAVNRISYLLKARMQDRLTWNHGAFRSDLTFDIVTTNSG